MPADTWAGNSPSPRASSRGGNASDHRQAQTVDTAGSGQVASGCCAPDAGLHRATTAKPRRSAPAAPPTDSGISGQQGWFAPAILSGWCQSRSDIDCALLQLSHTLARKLPYFPRTAGNLPTEPVDCFMPPVGRCLVRPGGPSSADSGTQHAIRSKASRSAFDYASTAANAVCWRCAVGLQVRLIRHSRALAARYFGASGRYGRPARAKRFSIPAH